MQDSRQTMINIKVLEVKSEIGAGTRGASMGPDAIKIAALDFGSLYFKKEKTIEVPNENRVLYEQVKTPYAKRIRGVINMYSRVSKFVKKTLHSGHFPIILAGDHSTAGGTIAGIKAEFPGHRLGVVWIDAHADLHSPYTTPSGNLHGMPLAASLGEDNIENKMNNLDETTKELWDELKNIGEICPKIRYKDLVYVGVRDVEPQESELIKKHKIRNFTINEMRKKGIDKAAVEILSYLDHCDLIYISFDVDSMDPKISMGTGTPVSNGLTEKEAGNLILRLVRSRKVCCFEIVEINPTLDKENLMAENAFEILQKVTNQLKNVL
jgi:arginase